ncbi:hypothetical protein M9Y10_002936 [Tritrichomonas musculus]|uniref:Uncharacterized protein n=1 Tax=Tritrichomonas musculus TaxID=1915356 RepID=A0ABR2LB56_9EUKA
MFYKEKESFGESNPLISTNLVSQFIDYLVLDDACFDEQNKKSPSFLINDLNIEIQEFHNNYNTFCQNPSDINQNNLFNILLQMRKTLRFISKFYEKHKIFLLEFPYREFFHLASLNNQGINSILFECLSTSIVVDLNFDINDVPQDIIQKVLLFILDYPTLDYSELDPLFSIIEFISILIQNSPQLCGLSISNGLFLVLNDWIQKPSCILALQSIIMTADEKYITNILDYCEELLNSKSTDLVNKSFHCFCIFIHRFGFININNKIKFLLYQKIPMYVATLKSAIELCLLIPCDVQSPPNILSQISDILSNPVNDSEHLILCLKLMIHFSSFWKIIMKKEDIQTILFFGVENKEFEVSIRFAECIIVYHSFIDFPFDLQVFQVCLNFLDSKIYNLCLTKMYEIMTFDASKFPKEISQMINLFTDDAIDLIRNHLYENSNEIAQLILNFLSMESSNE